MDAETKEMLKMMDFQSIPGLQMTTAGRNNGGWREGQLLGQNYDDTNLLVHLLTEDVDNSHSALIDIESKL